MTQLFDRLTRVTLNDVREIQSSTADPETGIIKLDVDVTHTAVMKEFPVATVVIWNPSDETVGECQSMQENDETVFPGITIEMGYVGGTDIVMDGVITAFKTDKTRTGRALTITASEKDSFKPEVSQKSFVNKKASYLFRVLASGFINRNEPGEDVLVPKLVVRRPLDAIRQVVALSNSTWYAAAGKINIIPAILESNAPTIVDFKSGLLEKPEKIESADKKEKGYLVKTLPLVGVRAGSSIKAIWHKKENEWTTTTKVVEGVIYDSKISLPSRGDASAEYKVAA